MLSGSSEPSEPSYQFQRDIITKIKPRTNNLFILITAYLTYDVSAIAYYNVTDILKVRTDLYVTSVSGFYECKPEVNRSFSGKRKECY